jgi:protein required for attachment to host cells
MDAAWIVAANGGRARFFAQPRPGAIPEEVFDMVNPAAREHDDAIVSDRVAGELAASKSRHNVGQPTVPSAYQPHRTPKQHEEDLFARDVSEFLEEAHNQGRFRKLILVASPEFLGVLRKQVQPRLGAIVSLEIDKDYTSSNAAELKERVKAHALPPK